MKRSVDVAYETFSSPPNEESSALVVKQAPAEQDAFEGEPPPRLRHAQAAASRVALLEICKCLHLAARPVTPRLNMKSCSTHAGEACGYPRWPARFYCGCAGRDSFFFACVTPVRLWSCPLLRVTVHR